MLSSDCQVTLGAGSLDILGKVNTAAWPILTLNVPPLFSGKEVMTATRKEEDESRVIDVMEFGLIV